MFYASQTRSKVPTQARPPALPQRPPHRLLDQPGAVAVPAVESDDVQRQRLAQVDGDLHDGVAPALDLAFVRAEEPLLPGGEPVGRLLLYFPHGAGAERGPLEQVTPLGPLENGGQ